MTAPFAFSPNQGKIFAFVGAEKVELAIQHARDLYADLVAETTHAEDGRKTLMSRNAICLISVINEHDAYLADAMRRVRRATL